MSDFGEKKQREVTEVMAQFSVETAWSVELEMVKNDLNNKYADLYSNAQS